VFILCKYGHLIFLKNELSRYFVISIDWKINYDPNNLIVRSAGGFMKRYLDILVKYNRGANGSMLSIAGAMDIESRMIDHGSFMKSIHGIIDHIAEGQIYFQRQIRNAFSSLSSLKHAYIDTEMTYREINFVDFNLLSNVIRVTNDAFVDLIAGMSGKDLEKVIAVESFEGEKKQTSAFIIIQAINHATHHRGQLSQIFDEMKIPNDFSGITG
jgi:uncharacterized damage-inducible protein DinB